MPNERKRESLSVRQKVKLVQHSEANPKLTQVQLAQWAGQSFNISVDRSTISKILKRKGEYLNLERDYDIRQDAKRLRTAECALLELALYYWFIQYQATGIVSDQLLIAQAKRFGSDPRLEVPRAFRYSYAWLSKFKKKFGINSITLRGEPASGDIHAIQNFLPDIRDTLSDYEAKDIYNMDEIALIYRLEPSHSQAAQLLSGPRRRKESISIALACNADGSDKLPLLIIGRFKKPRCFENINLHNVGIFYDHTTTDRINIQTYNKWLQRFDARMSGRKVALLMDNVPNHVLTDVTLSNTKVVFLPPNTVSMIQPLSAGIICNFRAKYRRMFLEWKLSMTETGTLYENFNLLEACKIAARAWNAMTDQTIARCWRESNALSKIAHHGDSGKTPVSELTSSEKHELSLLAKCVGSLDVSDLMTLDLYVNYEEKHGECQEDMVNDENEVIRHVLRKTVEDPEEENIDDDDDDDDDVEVPAIMSEEECMKGFRDVMTYCLQSRRDCRNIVLRLNALKDDLEQVVNLSGRQ